MARLTPADPLPLGVTRMTRPVVVDRPDFPPVDSVTLLFGFRRAVDLLTKRPLTALRPE